MTNAIAPRVDFVATAAKAFKALIGFCGTTPSRPSPRGGPRHGPRRAPPEFVVAIPAMLDGGMARRKREKRKWPPFGIPKGIVLLATPDG
ncbi:hypothetical protein ACGFYP_04010 [Streptomyces sp. NPDC048370]|uniref:hypothetical protein n=1 Tax=Streptomyces sp. NPDC048370 TaxID=3365540 RepID=UPI0037171A43